MLQSVTHLLSEYFDASYDIKEKTELPGGDIHHAYWISNGEHQVFIKYNSREHLPVFSAEAEQLALLSRTKTVRVPNVYGLGSSRDNSFLLLEFLPQKALDAHSAYCLGQQIAHLHQWVGQPQFGLDFDNDLNTSPQPNSWQKRWSSFFAEQRIGWQLQLAAEKGINFGSIDEIVERIQKKLNSHQPQPSLLHGDLWPANCGSTSTGPVVFDPACYWGDRECDLAMLPLHAHLPAQIYDGYQSIWPLPVGFIKRQPIYQLYYLLNRCNLFGGEHLPIAQHALEHVLIVD